MPEFTRKPLEKRGNTSYIALICMALVVIILAVYMQVGNHQFVYFDDDVYVTTNPHVLSGITVKNVIWAFTSIDELTGFWFPISSISHMADVQFFGINPRGHHLTNVVIHTISSLLLLLLLFRSTGSLWQSSFVAALFALHPLQTESVAWVTERKDVLSALFGFLTLLFYSEYVAKLKPTMYILSLFSFVLGLMSKSMLVTLPIVMLLMDFWPYYRYRQKEQKQGIRQLLGRVIGLIKEKIPFFACSLFSGIVTIYGQHNRAMSGFNEMSLLYRIENALIAYTKYIGKILWPRDLAVLYPLPLSIPLWQVISSLLILLLLSAAAICTRRRHPYVVVGWFWFLVTLVPVIGLLQVGAQSMADRFTYIPVIGLFIIVAWGVPELTKGLKHRVGILSVLAGAVIIASSALTWQQLGYWQDSISLFRHTLQVTNGNFLIHNNLGVVLAEKGNLDAAIQEYQEALRNKPNYTDAHINLGITLTKKGHLDAAIKEFQEALRLSPNSSDTHNNLGVVLAEKGNLDAAIQEYQEALRISPNNMNTHNNLAAALAQKRLQGEAWK